MNNSTKKPKVLKGSDNLVVDCHIFNEFLVNEEGEVLLLKRDSDNEYFPGYYHVLSGKLEENETYLEAFMRESIEEVGVELEKDRITEIGGPVFTKWDRKIWKTIFFDALVGNPEIILNEEHTEYLWVNPVDMPKLLVTPQVKQLIEIYRDYWLFDNKTLRRAHRNSKK